MRGLVVDIDDTLSETTKFWIGYFQHEFGNPENLSADEMYNRYHYVQNVPYWQSTYIKQVIHKLTCSNKFQHQIPLVTNANMYLHQMVKHVPITCYLTKRPEIIREGTEFWLRKHNFPIAPTYFRPNTVNFEEGNQWKCDYIETIRENIFAIIDDDENLIRLIKRNKDLHLFLFGQRNLESVLLRVYPCKDWDILYNEFLNVVNDTKC